MGEEGGPEVIEGARNKGERGGPAERQNIPLDNSRYNEYYCPVEID